MTSGRVGAWPVGHGESGLRVRVHDWASTGLGPIETWSDSLKRAAEITLAAPMSSVLLWGPDHIVAAYNDGYAAILADKPRALGQPVLEVWAEERELLTPQLARAFRGETLLFRELPLALKRGLPADECWFDYGYGPVRDGTGAVAGLIVSILEVTDRVVARRGLRESEERQALLLTLSDRLRLAPDPEGAMSAAAELFARWLGLSVAQYLLLHPDREGFDVAAGYSDGRLCGTPARQFGLVSGDPDWARRFRTGEAAFSDDHDIGSGADAEASRAFGIRSGSAVPLIREGRLVAIFSTAHPEPRRWTAAEKALQREVAERTWSAVERARAEAALRDSEERFRQFGKASSDGLWIRDAATLTLEYASAAMEEIYGVSREAMTADALLWPSLIVPEDRGEALGYVARVRAGESVVHEFRIQRPSDGRFRWIRSVGFPLFDNGHGVARIAGISSDVTEEKLLAEHQGVLLAELQHRVRNIMAIIRSIVARTAGGAGTVGEYTELLAGRLLTLARVQALLTRAPNAGVNLADIVRDELTALAAHAGQFDADGGDVELSPRAAETMTLAVHELAANALKHGALSAPHGKVTVRWAVTERRGAPWLSFAWNEAGGPPPASEPGPRRVGFGTELIEGRIPYELGGSGTLALDPGGARCRLEFPLAEGPSVLETDAPRRIDVFGGTIDMSGATDLSGQRILVVEDDYYLANDTTRALRGAGAEVIGPCPTEEAAREAILRLAPTSAILDINLNGGRSFGLAGELKERGVPFVFFTGYDQEVIPAAFADIVRLQKPVAFKTVIGALAQLVAP